MAFQCEMKVTAWYAPHLLTPLMGLNIASFRPLRRIYILPEVLAFFCHFLEGFQTNMIILVITHKTKRLVLTAQMYLI